MSTIPSYEQVKNKIVNQLAIAENLIAEYLVKPQPNKLILARLSLTKLSLAVSDYLYLAKDNENRDFLAYFLANPEEFETMTSFSAVLAVCKEIIYNLGITQIEVAKLPPWEAYKELE